MSLMFHSCVLLLAINDFLLMIFQTAKTSVMSASIITVCLMKEVLISLESAFNSLTDWRVAIGDSSAKPITKSLLLPLSCLALLKLTTPAETR